MLMLPLSSVPTATTDMPDMTALAGLVPCADLGMMHTSRCASPRERWYARMDIRPAYSPVAPEFGCMESASKPVMVHSISSRSFMILAYPCAWSSGAKGWMSASSGHVTGIISDVALSFMVQLPSGIIECTSDRSRDSSFARYRTISCSLWYVLNTSCVMKSLVRSSPRGRGASTDGANSAAVNGAASPPLSAAKSASRSSSLVVSSMLTCTAVADMRRRFMPLASADAITPSASPTSTVTASKNSGVLTLWPSFSAPAAKTAARPWQRSAICRRPCGPW
mmetsp:Transcript_21516/g.66705  ORF Transcript_21516/g.66705 Transcript_21516/m.66705 type:complete len:280 (+) Transcript_21516:1096-1935(+)